MAKKLKIPKKRSKWRLFKLSADNTNTEILGSAHLEIFGNSKISIDGCLGVYEYNDTYIKLRIYKGSVIICGSGLNIAFFEDRLITICGKISDVEFV
ncbi:MAG: YabP/YqfC family sporulation protein [Clostridia bacterium]|nr:YabP/YqfC family sporulation protein [Clostridia bacterium]